MRPRTVTAQAKPRASRPRRMATQPRKPLARETRLVRPWSASAPRVRLWVRRVSVMNTQPAATLL
ncbi:MAG: hypothetical protein JOZ65_21780 [Chloroflexi bacterium]|nr:hypothetical protein [Chloroflexota bacterium]